ncbi:MAG: NRDE family protein [Bacteroidetes bacterium]|nr:NRDE family protein [Bacteroidota bacterium]
MCTVTYLPLQKNGFILTSNRDESVTRKTALPPTKYSINGTTVFFPKDLEAQGTWIATSPTKYTLCLLNGAFEKHTHQPPYAKSRGLVLLDIFQYASCQEYASQYNFVGIEPFTLIIICNNTDAVKLYELRWDGNHAHLKKLPIEKPAIWSSVTLYKKEVIEQREQWFHEWLKNNTIYTVQEILFFHHFAGNGAAQHNLIMDIKEKKTVSVTSIAHENLSRTIIYEDLVNKVRKRCRFY